MRLRDFLDRTNNKESAMAGLDNLLELIDAKTDAFMRGKLGASPASSGLTEPGRFELAGLLTLLSLGAGDGQGQPLEGQDPSELKAILIKTALDRAHSPVTIDEAREIRQLLRSGAVTSDVASSLQMVLRLIPELPRGLVADVLALPDLPSDLVDAIRSDVKDTSATRPGGLKSLLTRLRDGQVDRIRLQGTLRVLLNRAATKSVVETLRSLIAPENRTLRLAILIYARMHGVDLKESDLDALFRALDTENPDLGVLLAQGFDRLLGQYKDAQKVIAVLQRLKATAG
ncbi:MAG: hypothetical protein L0027_02225 [Candidatus Rokubacteria bacterium]|nr:hypothetical protein [Candidatus Rokubacteria bacterium]